MPRTDQKSVTLPLKDYTLAVREAEKQGKTPTRWIRDQIHQGVTNIVEQPVEVTV